MNTNCLIVVGEKSGEEHALSFLGQIKSRIPNLNIWGVGGDQLAKENVELIYHLKDFSCWGFSKVIAKIPFYIKAENTLFANVIERNCKVAILVDFQTFNLRLAKRLKAIGVDVLYYVAPQAWAWKSYRVKILEESVHTLFTILPFEKKWFYDRGVKRVKAVQHPLMRAYKDEIEHIANSQRRDCTLFGEKIKLLLLPGSRNFEVQALLGIFIQTVSYLRPFSFDLGLVPSPNVNQSLYSPHLNYITSLFSHQKLGDALEWADMSLAASGTVSLACALFRVPTVVAYKVSLLDEFFLGTFTNYKGFFSLANIIHQEKIFPEFIQESCSSYNLAKALKNWLTDKDTYQKVKQKLTSTANLLDGEEKVGDYMAEVILRTYDNTNS